jgi:hypothetical protein
VEGRGRVEEAEGIRTETEGLIEGKERGAVKKLITGLHKTQK